MAKMHSRAKGTSGSKKPVKKIPSWSPYQGKEVEKLIIKYAKAGHHASEIGIILRDMYGIGNVKAVAGKSISRLLEENNLSKKLPEDLLALITKLIAVKTHAEKNRQDKTAGRGILLTTSKIRRIVKYYQRVGRLPENWKLDLERLKMYLE